MSGIKMNASDEKFFKEIALYTGPTLVKVIAVNPTLAELQELGINFQTEPEYPSIADDGTQKVRLDFWVTNKDDVKTKIVFFLENKDRVSTKGNSEFINNFGQSTWAANVEEACAKTGRGGMKWFKEDGARNAKNGETQLIRFLSDWLNVKPDDQVALQNFEALFTGNAAELKQYVKAAEKNYIFCMYTVQERNGKYYQNTLNDIFVRAQFTEGSAAKRFAEYINKKEDDGYPIKGEYSLTYKVFSPELDTPKPDADFIPGQEVGSTPDF